MDENHKKRNLVKAVTVLLGVIAILGLMGYLIYNMFNLSSAPPNIKVSTSYDSTTKMHRVVVENTGDTTAQQVVVRCQIIRGKKVIDTITITMEYLPSKSKKVLRLLLCPMRVFPLISRLFRSIIKPHSLSQTQVLL
ncbi:hypothetical protein [Galbibacter sp.]|uniref:hypothetical protein n=1 Tax=Galbibacter sp. TaxID=2918471 RepID=UPI002CA77017|nr:hypothetical protein [Galbibacter sp.]HLV62688.1 hypothetical protein [Galbibacter sp.]